MHEAELNANPPAPILVPVKHAATMLGRGIQAIYDLGGAGKLKLVKSDGRTLVVVSSIHEYVAGLQSAKIAPPRKRMPQRLRQAKAARHDSSDPIGKAGVKKKTAQLPRDVAQNQMKELADRVQGVIQREFVLTWPSEGKKRPVSKSVSSSPLVWVFFHALDRALKTPEVVEQMARVERWLVRSRRPKRRSQRATTTYTDKEIVTNKAEV
jgi:hypothetical protein